MTPLRIRVAEWSRHNRLHHCPACEQEITRTNETRCRKPRATLLVFASFPVEDENGEITLCKDTPRSIGITRHFKTHGVEEFIKECGRRSSKMEHGSRHRSKAKVRNQKKRKDNRSTRRSRRYQKERSEEGEEEKEKRFIQKKSKRETREEEDNTKKKSQKKQRTREKKREKEEANLQRRQEQE